MQLRDRFAILSKKMLLDFQESGLGTHAASKGENREGVLRRFLHDKLPARYGVAAGEILFRDGTLSKQTDVALYDRMHCPVLYAEKTLILPVDGVFGVLEVKSALSKAELRDAAFNVKRFKENAPRDLAVVSKPEFVTLLRPSRPFGIAFGYRLVDNSLDSLAQNWIELNAEVGIVNNWLNMVVVLGEGIVFLGRPKTESQWEPLLDTDALVNYTLEAQEGKNDGWVKPIVNRYGDDTLLYFYFYLNALLARTAVPPVDIGRYIDPNLPPLVHSVL